MRAGKLRQRITIQERVSVDDSIGGEDVTWVDWATHVPAAVEPLSAREFYTAAQLHSNITARITIRYRPGLLPTMRILHGTDVYDIAGVLPDNKTGVEYITLPVSRGLTDG